MPYAENEGQRIYYVVEGSGAPLTILPGFAQPISAFYETGYVEEFSGDHRVVLIDPRGQGESDKPAGAENYSMASRIGDVLAVLDQLEIEQTILFGYSMGGHTAMALASDSPDRVSALIAGGAQPFKQEINEQRLEEFESLRGGTHTYVEYLESMSGPIPEPRRSYLLGSDANGLSGIQQAINESQPDLSPGLARLQLPALLFAGTADDGRHDLIQQAAGTMRNARFVSLPDLDHIGSVRRSDLTIPVIREFLADMNG